MKFNIKILKKIIIVITITYSIFLLSFYFLGSIKRIGYISDININTILTFNENMISYNTTDINSQIEYIKTNENINIYVYDFKLNYHTKVFRNSDIYNVYMDLSNLPSEIKDYRIPEKGSRFGIFYSDKILNIEKIDNISYTLKIKKQLLSILFILIILIYLLHIIYIKFDTIIKIKKILIKLNKILIKSKGILIKYHKKIVICIIYTIATISFILLTISLYLMYFEKNTITDLIDVKLNINRTLEINGINDINNYTEEDIYNSDIKKYIYDFNISDNYNSKLYDILFLDKPNNVSYIDKYQISGKYIGYFVSENIITQNNIEDINYLLKSKYSKILIQITFILFLISIFLLIKFIDLDSYSDTLKFKILSIIFIFILMVIRKPEAISNFYILLDDVEFVANSIKFNLIKAIFEDFNGYYNLIPGIIARISLTLGNLGNNIYIVPLLMNIFSGLVGAYCISFLLDKRFNYLASLNTRILLTISIIYMPYSLQILLYATNLHWIIGYFLFLVSLDMIIRNEIPKKSLLIFIILCSLSSIYTAFIGLASAFIFIKDFYNFINNKDKKYFLNRIISLILVNIGTAIQCVKILFAGRTSGEKNIVEGFVSLFSAIITRTFLHPFYVMQNDKILLYSVFLLSIIVFVLLILNRNNKNNLYILMFFVLSILFVQFGTNYYFFGNLIYDNFRYNFIPFAILLTYIICNTINNYKSKNKLYISNMIIIIIISLNFLHYNIKNIGDKIYYYSNWKELSSLYEKNSRKNLFVYSSYTYGLYFTADIIEVLDISNYTPYTKQDPNFSLFYTNSQYVNIEKNINIKYKSKKESFIFFYALNLDNVGIDINNDDIIDIKLNKSIKLDNVYYVYTLDISEYVNKNINLIIEDNDTFYITEIYILKMNDKYKF